jgi:hypothetical protein
VRVHKKIIDKDVPDMERRRYFELRPDEDGMVSVRGRLSPDEAAILQKALDAAKTAGAQDT